MQKAGHGPSKAKVLAESGGLPAHYENFCQAVAVEGLSGAEAYRKCIATKFMERHTAQECASRVLSDADVSARISALRLNFKEFLEKRAGFTQETMGMYLVETLETPIGEITKDHRLASKLTLNDFGGVKSIEMFGKEAAADKLIKMAGWNAADKQEVAVSTTAEIREAMARMFAKKV